MTEIKCHLTLDNFCEDRADCFDSEVSVLQCVAVCVSVCQCVAVCCSVCQCVLSFSKCY